MKELERIYYLAGLQEARQIMDPDEEDRLDDERRAREQKIAGHIAFAFRAVGLTIAEDGIFYQEDNDREVIVTLDDSEADLALLAKLFNTGLSNRYVIQAGNLELLVQFSVSPELDHVYGKTP